MKKIILQCPICQQKKFLSIPEAVMEKRNQIEKGIVCIEIPRNITCDHSYAIYLDTNFAIRDYTTIDHIQELNRKKIVHFQEIDDLLKNLNTDLVRDILNRI
jgi:mannitol/fructose-specific phosphotransferase system IIA component